MGPDLTLLALGAPFLRAGSSQEEASEGPMRYLVTSVLLLAAGACSVHFQHVDNPPLEFTSVELPAYESERNIGWAASRDEYAAALADTRYAMRQFTYQSDGLTVGAYLYGPRETGTSP